LDWVWLDLEVNVELIGSFADCSEVARNEKNIFPLLTKEGRGKVPVIFPKPLLRPPLAKGRNVGMELFPFAKSTTHRGRNRGGGEKQINQ
jgi:hypothetical protein